jgi:hypothetical protein
MTDTATLQLPTGETVTPEDVFLFEGYPYRFRPVESEEFSFVLSPLYWGGGDMDVPFPDREALEAQWGAESRGLLTEEEWEAWLVEPRDDDRFSGEELDALEREVLPGGFLSRLRRRLGLSLR